MAKQLFFVLFVFQKDSFGKSEVYPFFSANTGKMDDFVGELFDFDHFSD